MSEREQAALAAGDTIEVEGKEYILSPVVLRNLTELEEKALEHFKTEYLTAFNNALKIRFPDANGKADDLYMRKVDEVARWDLSNLPQKDAYGVQHLEVTDSLTKKLLELYEGPQADSLKKLLEEKEDFAFKRLALALLTNALDSGTISSAEVKELTGRAPLHGHIRYDQWWVTATSIGQSYFIWKSVSREHKEITRNEVLNWPPHKMIEAAYQVEKLTSAKVGNG